MTPLFRHPDPDDLPSAGEVAFAVIAAIVAIALFWIVTLLQEVAP